MHLTMRLADVERRDALRGEGAIAGLLKTLVHRVDMRILAGPLVAEELGDPDHQGWSGVVILYESHAAIHTYPELGQAFLDVFSCREFDIETVKDTLAGFFGDFSVVESRLVDRGIHWSADVEREMASWRLVRS